MPWQGDKGNMIDRFDGRAHLDFISEVPSRDAEEELDRDEVRERRYANYERYRILVQNEFLKSNFSPNLFVNKKKTS
jgi:splicing factor, arginine/serine-rich 16